MPRLLLDRVTARPSLHGICASPSMACARPTVASCAPAAAQSAVLCWLPCCAACCTQRSPMFACNCFPYLSTATCFPVRSLRPSTTALTGSFCSQGAQLTGLGSLATNQQAQHTTAPLSQTAGRTGSGRAVVAVCQHAHLTAVYVYQLRRLIVLIHRQQNSSFGVMAPSPAMPEHTCLTPQLHRILATCLVALSQSTAPHDHSTASGS